MRLLDQRLHRHGELQAELEQQRAVVARAEAAAAAAAAELAAAQQAQQAVQRQAQQAQSAASARALQASVAAEVEQLDAAVAAKQGALAEAASQVEATSARLAELQAEKQRLQATQQAASRVGASGTSLAALQAQARQQVDSLSQLRRQEQRLTAEVGTLAARLGGGSGDGWRPLHRCFSFRDPAGSQQHAAALQVVAGGRLGVLVADSTAVAGRLLEGGAPAGARIWPLDGLAARDHSAAQRAAAQRFPPGAARVGPCWRLPYVLGLTRGRAALALPPVPVRLHHAFHVICPSNRTHTSHRNPPPGQVVLPADLLEAEPRWRPALLRAFGSHVLAANDAGGWWRGMLGGATPALVKQQPAAC